MKYNKIVRQVLNLKLRRHMLFNLGKKGIKTTPGEDFLLHIENEMDVIDDTVKLLEDILNNKGEDMTDIETNIKVSKKQLLLLLKYLSNRDLEAYKTLECFIQYYKITFDDPNDDGTDELRNYRLEHLNSLNDLCLEFKYGYKWLKELVDYCTAYENDKNSDISGSCSKSTNECETASCKDDDVEMANNEIKLTLDNELKEYISNEIKSALEPIQKDINSIKRQISMFHQDVYSYKDNTEENFGNGINYLEDLIKKQTEEIIRYLKLSK